MFNNIAKKIKGLAKVVCWLGIICSVFAAIAAFATGVNATNIIAAILILVVGCIGSWAGSFITYGFGQLIENTDKMANK